MVVAEVCVLVSTLPKEALPGSEHGDRGALGVGREWGDHGALGVGREWGNCGALGEGCLCG